MSEDYSKVTTLNHISQRNSLSKNDRNSTKKPTILNGFMSLRLTSPKTMKAYSELGYSESFFKIKSENQFGGPNVSQEIRGIRYQHHLKKLQTAVDQVVERRQFICENNKSLTLIETPQYDKLDLGKLQQGQYKANEQYYYLQSRQRNVQDMFQHYNQAIKKLQNGSTEQQSNVKGQNSLDAIDNLEYLIGKEIGKFQKIKFQKIVLKMFDKIKKEAKLRLYEKTNQETFKEKFQNRIQRQILQQAQMKESKQKRQMEIKLKAKEKLNQMVEQSRQSEEIKLEESRRTRNKLEIIKQGLLRDQEVRQNLLREKEIRQQLKSDTVLANKSRLEISFVDYMHTQHTTNQSRIYDSEKRLENNLKEKQDHLQGIFMKDKINMDKFKNKNDQQQLTKQHYLIQKLINREESSLSKQKSQKKLTQSKLKSDTEKNQFMKDRVGQINQDQEYKCIFYYQYKEDIFGQQVPTNYRKQLKTKSLQTQYHQERLDQKIEQIHEMRSLKSQDFKDNYIKNRRLDELEYLKMIQKDQQFKEKQELGRVKTEILKKIKMEVHRLEQSTKTILDDGLPDINEKNQKNQKLSSFAKGIIEELKQSSN